MVDTVRDRTAGPAVIAARTVVYGMVAAILAIPLFILLLIGSMRALEAFLIDHVGLTDPVWLVYLTFGLLFVLVGVWSWSRARKAVTITR